MGIVSCRCPHKNEFGSFVRCLLVCSIVYSFPARMQHMSVTTLSASRALSSLKGFEVSAKTRTQNDRVIAHARR